VRQSLHGNERLFVRKAQYTFGWDIAPRLVSAGIWRGVFLAGENAVSIDDVHIATRSVGPVARLTVGITATNHSPDSKQLEWKFKVLDPDAGRPWFPAALHLYDQNNRSPRGFGPGP
jgi:beta-mannosidase